MNVHDLPDLELAAPGPEPEMPECGNRGRGDRRFGCLSPTISKDLRVLEATATGWLRRTIEIRT